MSQLTICIIIFALSLVSYALNKFPMAITALGTMALLIFTGCLDGTVALSGFANTNTVVIVGMFVIAAGFNRTQFVDKLSAKIVQLSGGSYKRAYLCYILMVFILTSFLTSAMVAFAIVFPLYSAMCKQFDISPSKGIFALVVVSIGCCAILPFGTAVMLSGQFTGFFESYGFANLAINPIDFTIGRWPIAIILLLWAYFVAPKFAPDKPIVPISVVQTSAKDKKPLPPFAEAMGYIVFFGAVLLLIVGEKFGIKPWMVCLAAPIILVMCGTLTEKDAINAMPISIAVMYVGALAMGNALSATGAGEVVGNWLAGVVGGTHNSYVLGALFFIVPFILTQFMLNQAVTNIFVPICLLTCSALGANPMGLAILVPSACMTAYLTPMATPSIPMAMGAGGYDIKSLLKQGWLISLVLAVAYVGYTMTVFPAF